MAHVTKVTDARVVGLANSIRDKSLNAKEIKQILTAIGCEIGRICGEAMKVAKDEAFITPQNVNFNGVVVRIPRLVVITTKADAETLGHGISASSGATDQGYINFQGIRGKKALNAPVREACFPNLGGHNVEAVIVGKAVLATGCTAISLTKSAITQYMPSRLFIASIFYSKAGLADLVNEFPRSEIIIIGNCDGLDEDGMLIPGVGDLDARLAL
ncbi:conserved protein of unknown function (plasmid) [Rhodovastum atsumiense]|uniref:Phosphoribosyltransferase domain-containing protein n=1 Tax=Rhodovastum atsumiense TaxID=504468 RepID=A0A5M6IQ26_9PROT|nr:uracil phosphoribosyltransferase [Rhodovastum atsumiense]KAA5609585.1 hypothetical protein F1189_23460 [Rhodovastum atsumiense]CAH2606349.1 conserved protein of unknown function [Rhodovastum atsumiense]